MDLCAVQDDSGSSTESDEEAADTAAAAGGPGGRQEGADGAKPKKKKKRHVVDYYDDDPEFIGGLIALSDTAVAVGPAAPAYPCCRAGNAVKRAQAQHPTGGGWPPHARTHARTHAPPCTHPRRAARMS